MRKNLLFIGLLVIALSFGLFSVRAALADSPHFLFGGAALSGADLQVNFKEAGLGDNQLITYVASATSSATYACVNNGGNHPQAANKTFVSGLVSTSGQFSSGQNGNVFGSLLLQPIGPGNFACPAGQTLELVQISYSNIQVKDTTNGVSESVPGTFSACLQPTLGLCA